MCDAGVLIFTYAFACAAAFTHHFHNVPRATVDFAVAVAPRLARAAAQALIALTIFTFAFSFVRGFVDGLVREAMTGWR